MIVRHVSTKVIEDVVVRCLYLSLYCTKCRTREQYELTDGRAGTFLAATRVQLFRSRHARCA